MSEHIIPIFGVIVSMMGIIAGVSIKVYLNNRTKNTSTDISKGVIDTEIEHFKIELTRFKEDMDTIEEDIQKNHLDYDAIQRQISDIRERLARLEGPTKH